MHENQQPPVRLGWIEDRRWRKSCEADVLVTGTPGTEAYARAVLKRFWGVRDVVFESSVPGCLEVVVLLNWWCWLLFGLWHRWARLQVKAALWALMPAHVQVDSVRVGVLARKRRKMC